jgi:acetyltransferase-like isoleucine patch superfamily enzyme
VKGEAKRITLLDHVEARMERRLQLWRGRLACWRGVQAGARFGLGPGVRIFYPRCLIVGDNVTIEGPAYLHCLSEYGVRIGSHSSIGPNLWLHCGGLPTDYAHGCFELGEYSFMNCNATIGASGGVRIGNHVQIGPNLVISSENHVFDDITRRIDEQGVIREEVIVEDDCWIGSNVTILAGVTLRKGSVVAAGAVVTRDVSPNSVVAGVPAKLLRRRG